MPRCLSIALLVVALFCVGCAEKPPQPGNQTTAGPNSPGTAAAQNVALKLLDHDGVQALIKSHQGKVVVVDCWSTSCEPCVAEFPNLVALSKKHQDKVACISVSFDYDGIGKPQDKQENVLAFLKQNGATFDNVLSTETDEDLSKKMGIASIPVVFVYDQTGKLAKRFDNEDAVKQEDLFTYEHVSALVEELAKKQ